MHAAELDSDRRKNEEGRAVFGKVERIAAVTICILSAQKLYLAVWEEYFLGSMTCSLALF